MLVKRFTGFILPILLLAAALVSPFVMAMGGSPAAQAKAEKLAQVEQKLEAGQLETAIFAGGCFWCMEPPYEKLEGVISAESGYTDGRTKRPTYKAVSAGITGHTEAVEVVYDPSKVSYQKLVEVFWLNIDPLVKDRQFCDKGSQYRSGIYYKDDQQKAVAEASLALVKKRFGDLPIYTEIKPASTFYKAESYHQDYYIKNPIRYKYYRNGCKRDERLQQLWGDIK